MQLEADTGLIELKTGIFHQAALRKMPSMG